ncbi:MAG: phosphonopyruvate decarboxylase [Bacteroidota bacterium]|nr:phosphonopyruvate decarboxylase [Bacteroidota bacterium]
MIRPEFFLDTLERNGIGFFAGVPDSLLKNFCSALKERDASSPVRRHVIAANEGGAVGLAAGHYLATGEIGCVYMQNSGEGNAVNPLASLMDKDVYGIPALLLIGWRGEPGVKDEPQHVKQGKVTLSLLDCLGIPYAVLGEGEGESPEAVAEAQVREAVSVMKADGSVYALVVRKGAFSAPESVSAAKSSAAVNVPELSRESAIQAVAAALGPRDIVVSTTGMISRELFEYRESAGAGHGHDFLTVGSMGHASQIALGIALERPDRLVCCFDGDGAVLMHMGGMAIIGQSDVPNYLHVVFNNGAHDSVGGQPTVGLDVDLCAVACAVGYRSARRVSTLSELRAALSDLFSGALTGPGSPAGSGSSAGPAFLEIVVRKGNRPDLGRPTTTPVQNRDAFMDFLSRQ